MFTVYHAYPVKLYRLIRWALLFSLLVWGGKPLLFSRRVYCLLFAAGVLYHSVAIWRLTVTV